jgi:hypothetical protein
VLLCWILLHACNSSALSVEDCTYIYLLVCCKDAPVVPTYGLRVSREHVLRTMPRDVARTSLRPRTSVTN